MKRHCDCAPVFPPELRLTGDLDPPQPGYFCYVCKKKWHQWRLSEEYKKRLGNMARTYKYSVKPTFEYKLQSEKEFKRIMKKLEIKKINVSAKGEYSCTF